MSDSYRKDFATLEAERKKPDDEKTFTEKLTENITNTVDRTLAFITPDEQKSFAQRNVDENRFGSTDATKKNDEEIESKSKPKVKTLPAQKK